jgi:serine/threonine protein kinase
MKTMPSLREPSGYVLEAIREGAEFTLYRARQHGDPMPLLVVAPTAEQPLPQSLRRLEHEYSLAGELDSAWAAKPLALTRHEGRTILVLADPGGEPLDRVLERDRLEQGKDQPLDLPRLLRLAIHLATALGHVHQRGLIHKDVKPENVLVALEPSGDAGHVWLTGFGIVSRLPRERQAPAPPEIIAGTLAYMSPEQTGRMNRSIDARSDLYSLGVTSYQMLTGVLPFAAADPLEWVHCPHGPGAAVRHHHEAPRQKCRGALSDRCGSGNRSSAVPVGVAVAWSHRSIPSGHGRLVGPIADAREAVR